ncbi:MAG: DUF3530 family protein [Marinobacter sp.]|uniref:DUF3530 family protein n=1 Tax=Marinobacter sp. TaxID=50741 RepID=UPI0034A0691A
MRQKLKKGLMFTLPVLVAIGLWSSVYAQDEVEETRSERVMVSPDVDSEALAKALPEQAIWLENERSGRALALFEAEQTAQPKGAVLLLADEGQSANTGLAGAIREPFAEAGWAAMTLGLPALPLVLDQARRAKQLQRSAVSEESASAEGQLDDEQETEAVMIDVMDSDELAKLGEDYQARVQARLTMAVDELTERGYERLVLVGIGRGASHVISHLAEGTAAQAAVVMIGAEFESAEGQPMIDTLKAVPGLSLLDIVSSRSGLAGAKARQSRMKREGVAGYQQRAFAMGVRPLPRDARGLVNRMTGWLRS